MTARQVPTTSSLRVALLGAGRWGARLGAALGRIDGASLVAVADPDRAAVDRARALAPNAAGEASLDALWTHRPDAVLVATPPELHAAHARAVLRAGCDLLVEKPLAISAADAHDLVWLARSSGRVAMVGHVLRFHPAYERLDEVVAARALGALVSFRARRHTSSRSASALWSLAPHDLATLHAIDPSELVDLVARRPAPADRSIPDGQAERSVEIELRLRSGLVARLSLSTMAAVPARGIVLEGTRGQAIVDELCEDRPFRHERFAPPLCDGLELPSIDPPFHRGADALGAELAHFMAAVAERRPPRCSLEEGRWVVDVIERAEQCLAAPAARASARAPGGLRRTGRTAGERSAAASPSPPAGISVIPPVR